MFTGLVLAAQLGATLIAGRVAIVASASTAAGQAGLRYAERDADRVASVLRELGSFDRVYQLREARPQVIRDALAQVESEAAHDPKLEVVFYFSGHADDQGLLLGDERLPFAELRSRLETSRAAVRVALLDACFSGSIVRTKGGKEAAGFALDTVEPPRVRGAAIIAAGTASELAQESSDIEGSYFTHHFLSALRGAADRDGNGVVTLAEAYQYTYSHTLAATLPSVWGPQHPSYEYRLSGTGDLGMTRVGSERQALSFPSGIGRTYVISTVNGEVMAELSSQAQGRVRLVLPRGRYRVTAREGQRAWIAEVALESGADTAVERTPFRPLAPELALAKGHRAIPRNELALGVALSGLGPGAINGTPELGLGYFRRGTSFSFGSHFSYGATEGTISGIGYSLRRWTATALVLRRLPVGATELQIGAGAGLAALREVIGSGKTSPRLGWVPSGAIVVAMDLPLVPWFALRVTWSGGVDLMRLNGALTIQPELKASLAAIFRP